MDAVIYARFSSDRQSEASIDAQVRACVEYAEKNKLNIIHTYADEAISGTTANRIEYQRMLSDAFDEKFSIILIHKYDRIARNLEEQVSLRGKLRKLNIKLIAVAQNYGEGKDADLSRGIQWVLGEYYSANLAEETRKGHKETALKGLHNGGIAPFGYDIFNQKYQINEQEAYYVRRMFQTCLSGEKYNTLIEEMGSFGITGKRGKPIKYTQIYEILNNEKYTGTYVYSLTEEKDRNKRRNKPNAIRVNDAIPPIVDRETFELCQNIMKSRRRSGRSKHRCSGLVYCGKCGAKMHYTKTVSKGHEYRSFICSNHCGAHIIRENIIDSAIDSYFDLLFSKKNIADVEKAMRCLNAENHKLKISFEKEKQKLLETKQKEIENITNAIVSGSFTENYAYLDKLLSEKRKELEIIENSKANIIPEKKIRKWIDDLIASNKAPNIFIERINATTTEVEIITNLASVVGEIGCGGTENIFPATINGYYCSR